MTLISCPNIPPDTKVEDLVPPRTQRELLGWGWGWGTKKKTDSRYKSGIKTLKVNVSKACCVLTLHKY